MPFQFDHLRTLTALVDEGTFESAARRLHVTSSAVSQRVRTMEQTAGQVLVQRTNPVVPTEAGDAVLRYARQVLLLDQDVLSELRHGGAENRNRVPLAVNADSLSTWFLEALSELPPELGAVFEVHREDEEHTTGLLRSGAVMAAVTSTPDAVQGCSVEGLGVMRYQAVCSPEFAERHGVRGVEGLNGAPVVNFDRRDDLQDRFLRDLTGEGSRGPRHYIPASEDFARTVLLGFGWGAVPEHQCARDLEDGRLVALAPEHPVEVRLFWQRWNLRSPLLDEVTRCVREGAAARLHPM
ncbi:transcriptional regulator ArgP [Nocardiopsis terrae]|uniref:LysR family transcriptional regulator (Chromosome initiation inhibitor) n=1 Tax=Nocardiopsis terrae TaxID=372655 RepID=A0ABR9HDP8_9ACTN|nr:LysR family transcriptional regulator ArgP [Nocardiopsis terrae]MBE1457163.1 LysR family transcriptional regulator (chromosome initiation inhibitor) [Nocardiopsis terrae]GHC90971.1 transcriptional regulator ArgP [Nocardiopsis terrae]